MIQALDVPHIYDVPLAYHAEGLDDEVLAAFGITDAPSPTSTRWDQITRAISNHEGEVTIAVVGKYTGLKDAYKSLVEALAPRRHRQHGQGQARVDRGRHAREAATRRRGSTGSTASSFPAASASAARRA